MGIFDKKQSVSRENLKSTFKKDPGIIPGTGGRKYYEGQRQRMAREVFGPKYGSEISKNEYRKAVRDLKSAKSKAKTFRERSGISREINYLKRVGGKRI